MQVLLLTALLLGAVRWAGADADAEKELEAAIYREIVIGDLSGALQQYTAILSQPGTSRKVAAKALFQMGQCREKSGRSKEASDIYRRVVTEYGDQADVVAQARVKLAAWSGPRNLAFEEGTVGKVPQGWFVPSLPKDADYVAELRRDNCRTGSGCAVVVAPPNVPGQAGNLMQSVGAAAYRGKTVRLRAWVRLQRFFMAASGFRFPAPEDRAQMWLSVERANRRTGFSDSMGDRPVRSLEWTRCQIVGDIDADAQFIQFGVMSIGGGRVWVDDVSFEVIPKVQSQAR